MPKILPYGELEEKDYREIGFKSGLEIHQQLLTEKKLFCRCPAGEYLEEYHAEVLRHMRPTLSELGEYDGTALMEFKTKKQIIYQLNKKNVCTYEMDDTPPFELDEEALDVALEIALLLNCNIVGELHIARKQYLDGSIPAGFQRTTILGTDGWIPYKDGKINIIQLGLEEDACREVSDERHTRVYKTDRLSIPLSETVTYPEMRTPREVAEVAEIIRELVRSTGKVRRGIGKARQDVNVSVEGGTRVELKGVPRIPLIPALTHYEALRQFNLLEVKEELRRRGISKDTLKASYTGVTEILKNTGFKPIKKAVEKGWRVIAVGLTGYKGLLQYPLQPGRDLAGEISDRVRVIACLDELPNIIHYEMEDNPLSNSEWDKVQSALGASREDAVLLVWGEEKDSETAAQEIIIRAGEAAEGIPNETRQAYPSGINGFERILPGPDRMYPDTDMPPVPLTEQRINRIKSRLPMTPAGRRNFLKKLELHDEIIEDLVIHEKAKLFREIAEALPVDPTLVAVVLTQTLKHLEREGADVDKLSDDDILELLMAYSGGKFTREAVPMLLKEMIETGAGVEESLRKLDIEPMREDELDLFVHKTFRVFKDRRPGDPGKKFRFLMGRIMEEVRGRIDGRKVEESLKKVMNEMLPGAEL